MKLALDHGMTDAEAKFAASIEDAKDAKFIGLFPIGGLNMKCYCFYQKEAHPRGSNYFGLYLHPLHQCWMIIDAGEVEGKKFGGIEKDGRIIYSRYRHDYREYDGSMVDGGWDYFKHTVGDVATVVQMTIHGGNILVEDEDGEEGKKAKA